jgi:hypothetical protein
LLQATGRCPPEDIGGPPGYAEVLETIADPRHEHHVDCKEWMPEDFDPNIVDAESIAESLLDLAKQRSKTFKATQDQITCARRMLTAHRTKAIIQDVPVNQRRQLQLPVGGNPRRFDSAPEAAGLSGDHPAVC